MENGMKIRLLLNIKIEYILQAFPPKSTGRDSRLFTLNSPWNYYNGNVPLLMAELLLFGYVAVSNNISL